MSRQLQEIAREFARRRVEVMALATLARATGSSYLRPGARMLITASGETFGLLSGGCIEEEVARCARDVMRTRKPCVMAFDTRLRFGCSGQIEIFVERVDGRNSFLNALVGAFKNRTQFVSVTVFENDSDEHEQQQERLGSFSLADAARLWPELKCQPDGEQIISLRGDSGDATALIQPVQPPVRIVIAGSGPDTAPLAALARAVGWQPLVVCGPDETASEGDALRCSAGQLPFLLNADDRTVAVVMTHNYGRDFAFLRALLPLGLKYVGLVGSRKRKEQLIAQLLDNGIALSAVEAMHGPAGLDLGAESPEEIALSIIAEIHAVLAERPRHSLRDRKEPIHARLARLGKDAPVFQLSAGRG